MKILLKVDGENTILADCIRGVSQHFGPSDLQIMATRTSGSGTMFTVGTV